MTALRPGTIRRLAVLYTSTLFLEWFGSIALVVIVFAATQSPIAAAVLLVSKQIVPALVTPFAAGRIEALGFRRAAAIGFATQAAGLATIAWGGYGWSVYPLVALIGTAGATCRAAQRAEMVRAAGDRLRDVNAALNIVTGLTAPAGPAVAAWAVSATGAAAAVAMGAAGMAALAIAAAAVPLPGLRDRVGAADEASGGDAAAPASRLGVARILLLAAAISCVYSMDQAALLPLSEHRLGAGVGGYGAIFAAWGAGIVIGTWLFARFAHRPMLQVFGVATLLSATAVIGIGSSTSLALALAFAVLGGIGNGMDWVALVTAVQEATPVGRETWVAARLEAIGLAGPAAGIMLGGLVASVAAPQTALVLSGALALLILASLAAGGEFGRLSPARLRRSIFSPSISGGAT